MTKRKEPILKGDPILYRADGTQEVVRPANGKKFELRELKKFVHGTAAVAHLNSGVRLCVVNRAAKRQRDLAQKYYQQNMHGFAASSKRLKRKYYDLKDRGIMTAHQAGSLVCAFRHGGLYLWQGEGYSFHSTLKPKGLDVPELPLHEGEEHLFVEAKPMGSKEPRLRDAIETLETLVGYSEPDAALYERAPSPEQRREPRSITCWNCGLTGHVASECPEEESEVS